MKAPYVVGQKLWYVTHRSHGRREPFEVVVQSVGKKWVRIGMTESSRVTDRIDFTGRVDGGDYSSPGHCWPSKEAYERHTIIQNAWTRFTSEVRHLYDAPTGVTIDGIKRARSILFMEPDRGDGKQDP